MCGRHQENVGVSLQSQGADKFPRVDRRHSLLTGAGQSCSGDYVASGKPRIQVRRGVLGGNPAVGWTGMISDGALLERIFVLGTVQDIDQGEPGEWRHGSIGLLPSRTRTLRSHPVALREERGSCVSTVPNGS